MSDHVILCSPHSHCGVPDLISGDSVRFRSVRLRSVRLRSVPWSEVFVQIDQFNRVASHNRSVTIRVRVIFARIGPFADRRSQTG
jgi:hypothetical protein